MNISSIGTASYSSVTSLQGSSRGGSSGARQDFNALAKALQSGDLASAQDAFAKLQADAPSGAATSGSSPINTGFDALKKALDSGDLPAAQSALATAPHRSSS